MEEKEQQFPQIIDDVYEFIKILDFGGQGAVCLYQHCQTQEKVAIKFELYSGTEILNESIILRNIKENQALTRIPRYINHDSINGKKYLIMEYLEHSVSEYLSQYQGLELEKALCDVSVQMLEALEQFHSISYIHRDVKPDNFRVNNGKVYIIDFGISFEYLDKNRQHRQHHPNQVFKGSLDFASINCHDKYTQSRRDDLEGLGYTILFFLTKGNIDFMKIETKETITSSTTHQEFAKLKRNFIEENSISPSLYEIQKYLRLVRLLQFDEAPDYQKLKGILSSLYMGQSQTAEKLIDNQTIGQLMADQINENIYQKIHEISEGNVALRIDNEESCIQKPEKGVKTIDLEQDKIAEEKEKQLGDLNFPTTSSTSIAQLCPNFNAENLDYKSGPNGQNYGGQDQNSHEETKTQQAQKVDCYYCKKQVEINQAIVQRSDLSIKCYSCLYSLDIQNIDAYLQNEQSEWLTLNKKFTELYYHLKDTEDGFQFMQQQINENLGSFQIYYPDQLQKRLDHRLKEIISCQSRVIKDAIIYNKEKIQFDKFVNIMRSYKPPKYKQINFVLSQYKLQEFIDTQKKKKSGYESTNDILNRIESISVYLCQEKKEFLMDKGNENYWSLKKKFKNGNEYHFYYIITTNDNQKHIHFDPHYDNNGYFNRFRNYNILKV